MVGRQVSVLLLAVILVASAHAAVAPAVTDDQRLAVLAGKMLNLTQQGKDYTMDCGPAAEVLNLQPELQDQSDFGKRPYCVLNTSGKIVYGTFTPFSSGDVVQKLAELVKVYNDTAYSSQIRATDVNPRACDNVKNSQGIIDPSLFSSSFTECPNAIKGLHVYAYADDPTASGAVYLVVSETSLDDLKGGGLFSNLGSAITGFFKWFLGWL